MSDKFRQHECTWCRRIREAKAFSGKLPFCSTRCFEFWYVRTSESGTGWRQDDEPDKT